MLQQWLQAACAVAKFVDANPGTVQHGQEQVRHRRLLGEPHMPARRVHAAAPARQQKRQVVVVVSVAVADARPVQNK